MPFSWVQWKNNQFPLPSELALDTALEQSSHCEVLIWARHSPQRSPQVSPSWFGWKGRVQSVSEHLPHRGYLHPFSKTQTTIKSDFISFFLLSSSLDLLQKTTCFLGSFYLWLNLFFFPLPRDCHEYLCTSRSSKSWLCTDVYQVYKYFIDISQCSQISVVGSMIKTLVYQV